MKTGLKKRAALWVALGSTVVALLFVYVSKGLYPFGAGALADGGLNGMLAALRGGKAGVLLSLQSAASVDNWAAVTGGFLSPVHLLGFLLPAEIIPWFANLAVALKLLAAAAAMALLLDGKSSPASCGAASAGALGALYALSGFVLLQGAPATAYDALYILPVLYWAGARLVVGEKPVAFALCLAWIVWTNSQIGFLTILMLAVGFGAAGLFCKNTRLLARAARGFGICAVLAVLSSAPVWLPSLAADGGYTTALAVRVVAKTPMLGSWLYVFPVLIAAAVFLLLASYRKAYSRTVVLTFGFGLVPLLLAPLSGLWGQGYSTLPLFLGMLALGTAMELLYRRPSPERGTPEGITVLGVVYLAFLGTALSAMVHGENTFLSYLPAFVGGGACYAALFGRARGWVTRDALVLAMCCFVFMQGVYTGYISVEPVRAVASVEGRIKTTTELDGYAGDIGRLESGLPLQEEYLQAYKKLGYSGHGASLTGQGGTLVSDAFLNIQALCAENGGLYGSYVPGVGYGVVTGEEVIRMAGSASSQYTEDAVYAVTTVGSLPEGDRFDIQNHLASLLYGRGDLVRRYEPTHTENVNYATYPGQLDYHGVWQEGSGAYLEYVIEVGERESLYFDCFRFVSADEEEIVNYGLAISVNGVLLEAEYPSPTQNGILALGSFENETVAVRVDLLRSELVRSFGVAGVVHSELAQALTGANTINAAVKGGKIVVDYTAKEGQVLVLALPFNEALKATINGKDTRIYRVLDGFAAIELQSGGNQLHLSYTPPGFAAGWLLCALAVVLAAAWHFLFKARLAKSKMGLSLALRVWWLGGAGVLVFGVVAPLALWVAGFRLG